MSDQPSMFDCVETPEDATPASLPEPAFASAAAAEPKKDVEAGAYGGGEPHWITEGSHHVLINGRDDDAKICSGSMRGVSISDARHLMRNGYHPDEIGHLEKGRKVHSTRDLLNAGLKKEHVDELHAHGVATKHALAHLSGGGDIDSLMGKYRGLKAAKDAVNDLKKAPGQMAKGILGALRNLLPGGKTKAITEHLQDVHAAMKLIGPGIAGGAKLAMHAAAQWLNKNTGDWSMRKGIAGKLKGLLPAALRLGSATLLGVGSGLTNKLPRSYFRKAFGYVGNKLFPGAMKWLDKAHENTDVMIRSKYGRTGGKMVREVTHQILSRGIGGLIGAVALGPLGAAIGASLPPFVSGQLANFIPGLRFGLARLVSKAGETLGLTKTGATTKAVAKAAGAVGRGAKAMGRKAKEVVKKTREKMAERRRRRRAKAEMSAERLQSLLGGAATFAGDGQGMDLPTLAQGIADYITTLFSNYIQAATEHPEMRAPAKPLTDADNDKLEEMLSGAKFHAMSDEQIVCFEPILCQDKLLLMDGNLVTQPTASALLRQHGMNSVGRQVYFQAAQQTIATPTRGWALIDSWPVHFTRGWIDQAALGYLLSRDLTHDVVIDRIQLVPVPAEMPWEDVVDFAEPEAYEGKRGSRKGMAGWKIGPGMVIWADDPRYAKMQEHMRQSKQQSGLEQSASHAIAQSAAAQVVPAPSPVTAATQPPADTNGMNRRLGEIYGEVIKGSVFEGERPGRSTNLKEAATIIARSIADAQQPRDSGAGVDAIAADLRKSWSRLIGGQKRLDEDDTKMLHGLINAAVQVAGNHLPGVVDGRVTALAAPPQGAVPERMREVEAMQAKPGRRGGPNSPLRNAMWDAYNFLSQVGDRPILLESIDVPALHTVIKKHIPNITDQEFVNELQSMHDSGGKEGLDGTIKLLPLKSKRGLDKGDLGLMPKDASGQPLGHIAWDRPGVARRRSIFADEFQDFISRRNDSLVTIFQSQPERMQAAFTALEEGMAPVREELLAQGNRAACAVLDDLATFCQTAYIEQAEELRERYGPVGVWAMHAGAFRGEDAADEVDVPLWFSALPLGDILARLPYMALVTLQDESGFALGVEDFSQHAVLLSTEEILQLGRLARARVMGRYLGHVSAQNRQLRAVLPAAAQLDLPVTFSDCPGVHFVGVGTEYAQLPTEDNYAQQVTVLLQGTDQAVPTLLRKAQGLRQDVWDTAQQRADDVLANMTAVYGPEQTQVVLASAILQGESAAPEKCIPLLALAAIYHSMRSDGGTVSMSNPALPLAGARDLGRRLLARMLVEWNEGRVPLEHRDLDALFVDRPRQATGTYLAHLGKAGVAHPFASPASQDKAREALSKEFRAYQDQPAVQAILEPEKTV